MIVGITRGEDLLDRIGADHRAPFSVAISSPGGCGKTAVLAAIGGAYRRAGVPVVDLRQAADQSPGDVAILFDDAHLAGPAMLDLVEPLVDSGESRLFVAFRPWPGQPAIARMTTAIRRVGPVLELNHLDRDGVARRAHARGNQLDERTLDQLVVDTGGLPLLVDEVLTALEARSPVPAADGPLSHPSDVVDRVRRTVDQLDATSRRLLHAVAVGADLEPDGIARLLRLDADAAVEAIQAALATGFLVPDGRVIPLVAAALEHATSPQRTNDLRLALLALRTEQRRDGVSLARTLANSGVRDGLVADVLVAAGDQHLTHDPASAGALYDDAITAGAPSAALAVKRAASAARAGRFDHAMQLVDPVLADAGSRDLATGVYIASAVMAHRGLIGRAAELYTWLGPERIGAETSMATLALLATGQRAAALELSSTVATAPTMVAGARALMSEGVEQSIGSSTSTALSTLMRSTTLLESAEPTLLLPDTPAAITALVAIHIGDLDIAESAMRRAIDVDLGGPLSRTRHRLLQAWVVMLRGHHQRARELLEEAVARAADLSPRDELFAGALRLGIARRTSDISELLRAWSDSRDALFRHPVDLFVLLPLGEFIVAAARLRESERISAPFADALRLLRDLGEPVVWSTTLHWCGVQAAILNNRPADVEPHAAVLVDAASRSPFASALAAAGRAWIRVLADDVDPAQVEAAAQRLRTFGLAWDGSRLLGQAAAHSGDRRTAAALLQAARSLQDRADGPAPPPEQHVDGERPGSPSAAARRSSDALSGRELEVAALLLQQRTYREIGAQLYISSKTVEHHVARIKQRIGAGSRAELLARLRIIVTERASS